MHLDLSFVFILTVFFRCCTFLYGFVSILARFSLFFCSIVCVLVVLAVPAGKLLQFSLSAFCVHIVRKIFADGLVGKGAKHYFAGRKSHFICFCSFGCVLPILSAALSTLAKMNGTFSKRCGGGEMRHSRATSAPILQRIAYKPYKLRLSGQCLRHI